VEIMRKRVKSIFKPPFKISTRKSGYGKGDFIIVDTTGREYPHGGRLKTKRRATNYLKKVTERF
tara:strand:+ start:289 stop:480 length:192 start_codon:yes stop_codon:yes gene_type:complete